MEHHQATLLKLLAAEPTRRDRLEEVTGWTAQVVDAALAALEERGQVSSHAGEIQCIRVLYIKESLRHRLWQRSDAMAFELSTPTEVEFYHVNVRSEFHGEEHVRAVDIGFKVKGENTLLDLIKPGLREHHFCSTSSAKGQQHLTLTPLPNIRHPELATKYAFAKGQRWHGYRFVCEGANLDFEDSAIAAMVYEIFEGGSCMIAGLLQYNGDKLADDGVYGRAAGLTTLGKGRVQILAPKELLPITEKNWRSGEHATDQPPGGNGHDMTGPGPGFQAEAGADTEEDVLLPGTPAAALADAVAKEGEEPWPFPDSTHEGTKRRRRAAAAP